MPRYASTLMASPLTSIRIHLVWATWHRRPWLDPEWRARLFAHLSGVAERKGGQLLCAGGVRDHVHLYLECPETVALADLVHALKSSSTRWIHRTFTHRKEFRWQEGYAGFSVARAGDAALQDYIRNQEVHHRERNFTAEYLSLLELHDLDYDPHSVLD
jgi:putative transposase